MIKYCILVLRRVKICKIYCRANLVSGKSNVGQTYQTNLTDTSIA